MWVWREETVRGGWRLDASGSWTYDEPARLERVRSPRGDRDGESDRFARERFLHERGADQRRPALAAVPPLAELEATPIFRSVAHEVRSWRDERRREDRYAPRRAERPGRREREEREERARRAEPAIPEPHPGSGPFPAPGHRQRGLAPVEAVPPPAWGDDDRPVSAEDEVRRRAERRRRPRTEPESGRHVLRR